MRTELLHEWLWANMFDVPWVPTILLAYALGVIFTYLSIYIARRFDFIARPNSRSSHKIPTPRIGGVGICATFLTVMAISHVLYPDWGMYPDKWFFCFVLGSVWAAVGGLLDDMVEFTPPWKCLFQFVLLVLVFMFDVVIKQIAVPFLGVFILPYWLSVLVTLVVVIGLMNAYNFMDGMDGNAALFAVFVLGGMVLSFANLNVYAYATEALAVATLIGALLGFFRFNKPGTEQKFKTFMGDSGSQFVGFALAILIIRGNSCSARAPLIGSVLLTLPFTYDVVYTLAHRLWRRVNVFKGHREHLYQRLLICNNENHGKTLRFTTGQFFVAMLTGIFYNLCNWAMSMRRMPLDVKQTLNYVLVVLIVVAFATLIADTFYVRYREKQMRAEKEKDTQSAPPIATA